MEAIHPIGLVSQRTGLSAHVIRVWERRYGALTPGRTPANRRLYTDSDIRRLTLLRDAARNHRTIGQVATLSDARLEELIALDAAADRPQLQGKHPVLPDEYVAQVIAAAARLDPRQAEALLGQAAVSLGLPAVLESVVAPLMQRVGEAWERGELRVAHEHLATTTVRTFIADLLTRYGGGPSAPLLLATTPTGQVHEIGSMLAAAEATVVGWRAAYLGADLPAEEIAVAAEESAAPAIALSLVYPEGDPRIAQDLLRLGRLVPERVAVFAGGRAVESYAEALTEAKISAIDSLSAFRSRLQAIGSGIGGSPHGRAIASVVDG